MKTGLVLEGGAMRGMFTAGVLDVLMEHGIAVDGAIGVSAGAVFGCNYKSHQIGRTIRYNTEYCTDKRYASFGNLFTTADTGYTDAGIAASGNARGANNFNTPVKVVFNQGKENAAKVYNVYAKDLSGKITKLAATLDRGVLTFTVPALSYFIVTSDTVTASATQTPTTPGTTTNPGTGANDVVGVAAALAVVALVSGAAISLKK